MQTKFSEIKIGPFTVKIGEYQTECRYIIYESNKKKFSEGKNITRDEAIQSAHNAISSYKKAMASKRVNGIPTSQEFVKAFSSLNLSDGQWAMLKAHYNAPEKKLTSSQLAEAASYQHFYAANTQYGNLGRMIADYLDVTPKGKYKDGSPLWITTITLENSDSFEDDSGHYQHTLRKEVAEALEIVGGI